MGFFRELRERRLGQIIASYLVGGWAALEVLSNLIDRGIVPGFLYRMALVWFIGGIPAAVIIGWNHGEKGRQRASLPEALALGVIAVVVLGISGYSVAGQLAARKARQAALSGANLHRIAVAYFQDLTPDSSLTYLADGLTESLITELGQVSALDVVSRNGVAQFRGEDVPPDSIGRVLGAGTVVEGTVQHVGSSIRINVSLDDGQSGAEFRRIAFQRPDSDLLAIRTQVATEAAQLLRQWLGEEIRVRTAQNGADNNAAWALYERGERVRKEAEARLRTSSAQAFPLFDRADSLLVQAQRLDTAWAAPEVLRATLAYRRSRLLQDEPAQLVHWDSIGLARAQRALQLAPGDAHALAIRGTLRYWRFLTGTTMAPDARHALLERAREDLEAAVAADPSLASAYSTLSHLYYQVEGNVPAAVVAAQRAYEQDAYLNVANEVLIRLYSGNMDLQNFPQARHWCEVGAKRFSDDYRFSFCRLQLMTTPAAEPNVPRAWALQAAVDSLAPAPKRPYFNLYSIYAVAGVIARAGLRDSARDVLANAEQADTPAVDPERELFWWGAYIYTLLDQKDQAIHLVERAMAANPDHVIRRNGFIAWWLRPLENDPRFKQLESK